MFGLSQPASGKHELKKLWSVRADDYVIDLAWSPTGKQIAFTTVEGEVILVDQAASRGRPKPLGRHANGASSVAWRFDGKELATAGHDGTVKIWDPQAGLLVRELPGGAEWVTRVAYRPRGTLLASAAGRSLRLWESAGQVIHEASQHASTIADIAWNPNGSGLAVAAYNGVTIHLLHQLENPRRYEWKGSSLVLAWSPTSKYIATGEQDSTVHFWNVKTGKDCQMWGFPTKVLELSWHHSGDYLATGGSNTATLWDCSGKGPSGREPKMLEAHSPRISRLAFQNRADVLASGDVEGAVLFWKPLRGKKHFAEGEFDSMITQLAWSPDDQCLAVGQRAGVVTGIQFT